MSIERTWRCDASDCERHTGAFPHPHPPPGFLMLLYEGISTQTVPALVGIFCGNDCLLRHAAATEASETIPLEGSSDE